jgi:hypothetical protein
MTLKLYANSKNIIKFLNEENSISVSPKLDYQFNTEIIIDTNDYQITNSGSLFTVQKKKSVV